MCAKQWVTVKDFWGWNDIIALSYVHLPEIGLCWVSPRSSVKFLEKPCTKSRELRPVTRTVCGPSAVTLRVHCPGWGSFMFMISACFSRNNSFNPFAVVTSCPVNEEYYLEYDLTYDLIWKSMWWVTLAKMDWPNLEWYLEDRTPGSDKLKRGLSKGNVVNVEVDLEKNSQRYTTHF